MKIFGHPIHIMLIHFPSALLPMDFVCSSINFYTGNPSFTEASFYAMIGGVLLGWVAVIFGIFDLIIVFNKKPAAMNSALLHGSINTVVLMIFTVLAYLQFRYYPILQPDGILLLIIKGAAIGFMGMGNYLGGNLILKHKVGVENE